LANAAKHSKATEIFITLSGNDDLFDLHYLDNGIGMNLQGTIDIYKHMGIYGIKERVRALEGSLEMGNSSGGGLSLHINIPIHPIHHY
jgi:two-component system, NarL family, sensor histidine kinase ComP